MKNKNFRIYYWIYFIGIIISTFNKYEFTNKLGILLSISLILILSSWIILNLFNYIIDHNSILSNLRGLFQEYISQKQFQLYENIEPEYQLIDTTALKYIEIEKYHKLKNKYEEIIENLNLRNNIPQIKITKNLPTCYIPSKIGEYPVIIINEKEFNSSYLDFVLGHEISHHYHNDIKNMITGIYIIFLVSMTMSLLLNPYINLFLLAVLILVSVIMMQFKSRQKEFLADLVGAYFSTIKEGVDCLIYTKDSLNKYNKNIFSTHPTFEERIENVMKNKWSFSKANTFNNKLRLLKGNIV